MNVKPKIKYKFLYRVDETYYWQADQEHVDLYAQTVGRFWRFTRTKAMNETGAKLNELVTCERCKNHFVAHMDALLYSFSQIAKALEADQVELGMRYFLGFHGRGHRKVLRDDA